MRLGVELTRENDSGTSLIICFRLFYFHRGGIVFFIFCEKNISGTNGVKCSGTNLPPL